jgi:hypothetical protein
MVPFLATAMILNIKAAQNISISCLQLSSLENGMWFVKEEEKITTTVGKPDLLILRLSLISSSTTLLLLVGNRRFREVIEKNLSTCPAAKQAKSRIVTEIVNTIRENAGTGGFVKKVCFFAITFIFKGAQD